MNLLQPLSNNPLHKGRSPKLRKDVREMFEIAQNPNLSVEKKMTNREIGLRKLITQGEVNLLNGRLHGEEIFFDRTGEITERNFWDNGRPIGR